MATLPIKIEVQAEAAGPIMILLRKTPGIVTMHLDLDGFAPSGSSTMRREPGGPSIQETVAAALLKHYPNPVVAKTLLDATGFSKPMVHGALHNLKAKSVCTNGPDGWLLTKKAAIDMGALKLLPKPRAAVNGKPHKLERTPTGRAKKGFGWLALFSALKDGPKKRSDFFPMLAANGVAENSFSGVLERAQRDKLAKSDGHGTWELTAKGIAQGQAQQSSGE